MGLQEQDAFRRTYAELQQEVMAPSEFIPPAITAKESKNDFKPECGVSGDWSIEAVEIKEEDIRLENLRMAFDGHGNRKLKPGTFYRLLRGRTTVMSNTPAEMRDMSYFLRIASGNILINGLGLGIAEFELLKKPEVTKITVIEISQDVINLSGKLFKDNPRVEIIHADCFTYQPPKGVKYDYVWHDIWDNICSDNLPEMTKLHRKYARKTKWQDSWCKRECKYNKHRGGCW